MKAFFGVLVMLVVLTLGVGSATGASLANQCMKSQRALCADKSERKLYFVVGGKVRLKLDARFGDARGPGFRTAEGKLYIFRKVERDWSVAYSAPMPYSMYFHGGQAVHYSYSFAREGWAGSSHGCVNIRDMAKMRWLYNRVPVGTPIYIYA